MVDVRAENNIDTDEASTCGHVDLIINDKVVLRIDDSFFEDTGDVVNCLVRRAFDEGVRHGLGLPCATGG